MLEIECSAKSEMGDDAEEVGCEKKNKAMQGEECEECRVRKGEEAVALKSRKRKEGIEQSPNEKEGTLALHLPPACGV